MANFLDEIVSLKKQEVEALYATPGPDQFERWAPTQFAYGPRAFHKAISDKTQLNLIAEVKKASPSKGIIREDFDPIALAIAFEKSGAKALSILTETHFFKGDPRYIAQIKEKTALPILRKDFIIDPIQVHESKKIGADAILLIKAILPTQKLRDLQTLAHRVGLDVLVEVHNQEELDEVMTIGCPIIGINNRNLKTFEVDIKTAETLAKKIRLDHYSPIIVAESGYNTIEQLKRLEECGIHAVLIGEGLATHPELLEKPKFDTLNP